MKYVQDWKCTRRSITAGLAAAVLCCFASVGYAQSPEIPALKLRVATAYPKTMPSGIALEYFAKRVSELSGGKITGQIYHAGTLYSENTALQAVLDGTLEMGLASASNHGAFTKAWTVVEVPYLLRTREQFRDIIINGAIGNDIRKQSEADGLKPLMILETGGFRVIGTSRLAKTPSDLRNMKIRVPQSPVPLAFWKAVGANPTVIAWNETYLALASHTVDGVDASYPSWYMGKLYEASKFLTDVRSSSVASIVNVSMRWWEQRTPAQKEIILKAAREAEELSMREELTSEEQIKQELRKAGMTIYEPKEAEMAEWVKVGRSIWKDIPNVSQAMLERIQTALKSK